MPELPDVHGLRNAFARHASGKKVKGVSVDSDIVRNCTPQALGRALRDRRFKDPTRWGKWLLCPTGGPTLVLHFGMTGALVWSGDEPDRHAHDRMVITLADGELRYRNMRKLGGVWIAPTEAEIKEITGPLGPDAYEISKREFLRSLKGRRGSIKATLMNQRFVAGLGNLTVDETLWQARLAPKRTVGSLDEQEASALYVKMRKVLKESMQVGRVPDKTTWITGARRGDSACPRCGTRLKRTKVGGRTTYWCDNCQS
jgi:formamidopyrimidine-DNA glycosylase